LSLLRLGEADFFQNYLIFAANNSFISLIQAACTLEISSLSFSYSSPYENNNALVAFLILLFSIIVPIFKAVSLLAVILIKKLRNHSRLHKFIALISKWSMADVFVVGIFIAFLSTQSNEALEAKLGTGFYWFLAYCLISIAASQVMTTEKA